MNKKNLLVGAALTGLFAVSAYAQDGTGTSSKKMSNDDKIGKCYGINSCHGTGACGGKSHSCAGKNACKGKGWLKKTKSDCEEKGGTYESY